MAFLYWIHTPEMIDVFTEGYVGITIRSVKQRWSNHKVAAKTPSKQHLPICRAINKHNPENLMVETLVEGSEEYVLALETKLRPTTGIGWNCASGGQDTGKGRVHTPEEIEKRASKLKGRKLSQATKDKISESHKGKIKSPEHIQKIANAKRGQKRSEDLKIRQSIAMTGLNKITEDGRKRLSESKKSLREWEHSQANKILWASAEAGFVLMQSAEKFSQMDLARLFNVKGSSVYTLYNKLKAGWNPNEDPAWLDFKTKYDKEAINAAFA